MRELLTKPTSWILAACLLILLAQNAGLIGRASDVFGGGPERAPSDAVQQMQTQHNELIRQQSETNKKLDATIDQLRANGNSAALGFRILCLQNAKTDAQRDQCARIQ